MFTRDTRRADYKRFLTSATFQWHFISSLRRANSCCSRGKSCENTQIAKGTAFLWTALVKNDDYRREENSTFMCAMMISEIYESINIRNIWRNHMKWIFLNPSILQIKPLLDGKTQWTWIYIKVDSLLLFQRLKLYTYHEFLRWFFTQ